MKKILYTICSFALIAVPLIAMAARASNEATAIDVVSVLGECISTTLTANSPSNCEDLSHSLRNVFGRVPVSNENFGKDLYKSILKRVKYEASDSVMKNLTEAVNREDAPFDPRDGIETRNLTPGEIASLTAGGAVSGFLTQPDPTAKLATNIPRARQEQLIDIIAEEKPLADLAVFSKMEVESIEMFSNGDEADSGFDLVTDLDAIDILLFGRQEDRGDPAAPPSSSSGSSGGGSSASPSPSASPAQSGAGGPGGRPIPGGQPGSSGTGTSSPRQPTAAEAGSICPLNSSFNSAVETARRNEQNQNSQTPAVQNGQNQTAPGGGGNAGSAPAGNSQAADEPQNVSCENMDIDSYESAVSFMTNCGGFCPDAQNAQRTGVSASFKFCIKTEAIYKTVSSYTNSANCIACHFQKINDAFKKTLDHSLTPSKATGNMMEASKCKQAGGGIPYLNLKWNVIMMPKPVLTPPNDDLIVKADLFKSMYDFCKKFIDIEQLIPPVGQAFDTCDFLYGPPQEASPVSMAIGPDAETKATRDSLQGVEQGTDPSKILGEIDKQAVEKKKDREIQLQEFTLEKEVQDMAQQFTVLKEMETMNTYFKGFAQMLNDMVSDNPEAACKILKDKPQCD